MFEFYNCMNYELFGDKAVSFLRQTKNYVVGEGGGGT